MKNDSVIAAVWIKYRLDVLVQIEGDILRAPIGSFKCSRDHAGDLQVFGPGINEVISKEKAESLLELIQYAVEHGDSVVSLPRRLREEKIKAVSEGYGQNVDLMKVALSYAREYGVER